MRDVKDLVFLALQFNVDSVFKRQKWNTGHVYGTEAVELVIIEDIPGMISTTDVVNAIKEGRTSLGPIPDKHKVTEDVKWLDRKS